MKVIHRLACALLAPLLLLTAAAPAQAGARVAVLDFAYLDAEHAEIAPHLDRGFLERTGIAEENRANLERFHELVSGFRLMELITLVEMQSRAGREDLSWEEQVFMSRGLERIRRSPGSYREVRAVSVHYLHATHVASVAAQGSGPGDLVFIPLVAPWEGPKSPEPLRLWEVRASALGSWRARIRSRLQAASRRLRESGAAVASLSLAIPVRTIEMMVRGQLPPNRQKDPRVVERVLWLARELEAIWLRELGRLIDANPDVAFVISAGNEREELQPLQGKGTLHRPNTLLVAALDAKGALAGFSNWSPQLVRVGVPAVEIWGARVGGGRIPITGSSFAAPPVAAAIRKLRELRPALTAGEAIEAFLAERTTPRPELEGRIEGGRAYFPPIQSRRSHCALPFASVLEAGEAGEPAELAAP